MADEIVDPDSVDWSRSVAAKSGKGKTRYQHLLDGNCRIINIAEYGHTVPKNMLGVLNSLARKRGLDKRGQILNDHQVLFQVLKPRKEG